MIAVPTNGQTWLICGGREFADQEMFDSAMSELIQLHGCPLKVVHGKARGADTMAGAWARRMALHEAAVPVDTAVDGAWPAAGCMRNQRMLDSHHPDLVVAFPGRNGTADMLRRARRAGIDVAEIKLAIGRKDDQC